MDANAAVQFVVRAHALCRARLFQGNTKPTNILNVYLYVYIRTNRMCAVALVRSMCRFQSDIRIVRFVRRSVTICNIGSKINRN